MQVQSIHGYTLKNMSRIYNLNEHSQGDPIHYFDYKGNGWAVCDLIHRGSEVCLLKGRTGSLEGQYWREDLYKMLDPEMYLVYRGINP